jgi:hypothetical protein
MTGRTNVREGSWGRPGVVIALSAMLLLSSCSHSASSSSPKSSAPTRPTPSTWLSLDLQASFMDAKYPDMEPEPVESLRIASLRKLQQSASLCLFEVTFDITVKGRGVSMSSGRYLWSYELTRSAGEESWLITNYGAG